MSKMDLSGKLSLYDFLTMLVCGFMILALFVPLPSEEYQWIIFIILSYLIGLVYHRMLEFIRDVISSDKEIYNNKYLGTIFTSNNIYALEKARGGDCKQGLLLIIKDEYYKAYYSIMDKPCYSNISFLEAQEAFLRNFTWIVVVYAFFYRDSCICSLIKKCFGLCINEYYYLICFALIALILLARYNTQMKIYKLVWEGYKYTHNKE